MKALALLTALVAVFQFSNAQAAQSYDFSCRAQAADAIVATLVDQSGASESARVQVRSLELVRAGANAQGEWVESYLTQIDRDGFLASYIVTLNSDCEVTGFTGARKSVTKPSFYKATSKAKSKKQQSTPNDSGSPDDVDDEFSSDSNDSSDSYDNSSSGSCETYESGCSRGNDNDSPDSVNSGDSF